MTPAKKADKTLDAADVNVDESGVESEPTPPPRKVQRDDWQQQPGAAPPA